MRDQAFRQLGDTDLGDRQVKGAAPAFSVTNVQNFTTVQDPNMAREVTGTFTVPCYLAPNCDALTDSRFDLNKGGVPVQHGTYQANFDCMIPHSALDAPGAQPARASYYGHGLLGSAARGRLGPAEDARQQPQLRHLRHQRARALQPRHPARRPVLTDLGKFPEIADRLQQGLLDELLLGRLMDNPSGFLTHPAFHVSGADTTQRAGPRLQPPLLQRQQPGRDRGRGADRALARRDPGLARRPGDELLGPAHRARSTSTSTRTWRCTRTTRTSCRGRWR